MPLFNVEELETNPNYVDPITKRKWTMAFRKWCYDKAINQNWLDDYGLFVCGNMNLCKRCKCKYQEDCKDCVETIKKVLNDKFIKIDYNDYDFEKIFEKAEELAKK